MKDTLRPHQQRAYYAMNVAPNGQIIVPTGGGKTNIMIADCIRRLSSDGRIRTIVVVAPRILLANQLSQEFLSEVTNVKVAHVHSGETHHFSTTKSNELTHWNSTNPQYNLSLIHI